MSRRRRRTVTKAARPNLPVQPAATYTADQMALAVRTTAQRVAAARPLPQNPADAQVPFGPGVPLPIAPINPVDPRTGRPQPRQWEYPQSWNLPGFSDRLIPWAILRAAADQIALFRQCIEVRKNEISTLDWDIVISKKAVDRAALDDPSTSRHDIQTEMRKRLQPHIARLTAFWEEPDPRNGLDFIGWATKLLEEHFVLDAVAVYPRRTRGGDPYGLEILDGSTIKPLLDQYGHRPLPPNPAFQQLLQGFPRGEFVADTEVGEDGEPLVLAGYESDRLVYLVHNVRATTPYGYSAVEQALDDGDLWLKRHGWLKAEYSDGVMPSGWLLAGEGQADWSPTQLQEYGRAFNDYYAGQTALRQRYQILPYGMKPSDTAGSDAGEKYKPDYDLFLLKLVARHFDTTMAELGFTEAKGLGSTGAARRAAARRRHHPHQRHRLHRLGWLGAGGHRRGEACAGRRAGAAARAGRPDDRVGGAAPPRGPRRGPRRRLGAGSGAGHHRGDARRCPGGREVGVAGRGDRGGPRDLGGVAGPVSVHRGHREHVDDRGRPAGMPGVPGQRVRGRGVSGAVVPVGGVRSAGASAVPVRAGAGRAVHFEHQLADARARAVPDGSIRMNTTTVYAEIVKAERNADGDLVVVGKATGPDLDLDQQICDAAWLGKAMPTWFSTGANIREQHSSIAAGVGTELEQSGDSWMVTSLVVDKGSAEKVEKKVLKGYSIGISNPRVVKDAAAPGGRIVGGDIVEVSLVDRPCNPTAMLSLAKAAKPGMTVKASAFDREHGLVKTEEFVEIPEQAADDTVADKPDTAAGDEQTDEAPADTEAAKGVIAAVKALGVDLAKSTSDEDIASAQEAIAIIGRIIVSEAESLAAGNLSDACDIDELLCAVRALKWFMMMESEEDIDDAMVTIGLADVPDTTKTSAPADTARKTAGADLTELVNKAVAKAMQDSEERTKALEAELAKVKALPVPGGPVLTRTAGDTQKAATKDAVLAKAAHFRRLADAVTDPAARMGYLELAAQADTLA
jgi:hypothetical protein